MFASWSILRADVPVDGSVVTHGDINGDGVFDILDLIQLERAVVVGLEMTAREIAACDVDGDGKLTSYDLLVMSGAFKRARQGMSMFDAIKSTIETDLAKEGDNVEIYLDLGRFYAKENQLNRSRQVLESIMEALDTRHPLYESINQALLNVDGKEMAARLLEQGFDSQEIYDPAEDPTGKMSLRQKVLEMKNRLSDLMKDEKFAAHYDSKRTQGKLSAVMDDMLRKIGKDQMVDPGDFTKFNSDVRSVMEDPENLVQSLPPAQRNELVKIIDQSTGEMRETAMDLRQKIVASLPESGDSRSDERLIRQQILDRREWTPEGPSENMRMDRLIIAGSPSISPDTISIVAPAYTLNWDVSNVLGARDAALEISKADRKFTNPRSSVPDQENTLYYTPSMGGVNGQRRGSALELEGVGIYQYRVAAVDSRGEIISRFSDATELVVVFNNVNVIANRPSVSPDTIYSERPTYTFKWDVSNVEGARDAAVEISNPNAEFSNPNGRERDRVNTFFFNPTLGRVNGTFGSNIDGLTGVGRYLFRVIAVSPYGDFVGRWSNPDTLYVTTREEMLRAEEKRTAPAVAEAPGVTLQDTVLTVAWDVSDIENAQGVSLEVALADTVAARGERAVINLRLPGPSGTREIGLGMLTGPGRYLFRVAAEDLNGTLLTLWSRPAVWNHAGTDADAEIAPPETVETAPAPDGKELQVISANTPMYADKSLSSRELMSLSQGERLVMVRKDDMWYRVYYPQRGSYGWVLDFNVQVPDGH